MCRIVAIVVGACFFLIFFFVPETFWDRTPRPRERHSRTRSKSPGAHHNRFHLPSLGGRHRGGTETALNGAENGGTSAPLPPGTPSGQTKPVKTVRVGFVDDADPDLPNPVRPAASPAGLATPVPGTPTKEPDYFGTTRENRNTDAFPTHNSQNPQVDIEKQSDSGVDSAAQSRDSGYNDSDQVSESFSIRYTDYYRSAPPKSYLQSLKPWNGRLVKDNWFRVAVRPLILFAYPAVLWSGLVYSLAVGWLIVLSESVAHIYQDRDSYNFTSLQVGLVYISPFVGGVLGTAVAGKISDIVVRFMARKNDGVYEPEFRLVMAIPIAISTTIGLMGFGWSAEEKNNWVVPTVFFGVISFGCSLASTTSVTFVVDSYRIYAGEALVTLNFSKSKYALPL